VAEEGVRFPVRRIFCVGRIRCHAQEMGKDPDREPPFFFTKPPDSLTDSGVTIPYPPETKNFHYEIELIVAIGRAGLDIPETDALDHVYGYGVGIDLTRRDLQLEARDKGRPWDWGKAYDLSAPMAPLYRASSAGHPNKGRIWLAVKREREADADIAELIWSFSEIISILSRSMVIKPSDLIMTGTPAGVGPILPGDLVTGGIDGLGSIEIRIAPR
jgi:fumarylpyruvate hydrolase